MPMDLVRGAHHLTLSVSGAQDDVDFHTKLLGLRAIKKTVLFDGPLPVYHLYYANADGDAGSVMTTFPWAQHGIVGRRGSNQARVAKLSVPSGSLDFWADRLGEHGVAHEQHERFGAGVLAFAHPSGIEYELVGNGDDAPGAAYAGGGVPVEHGVRRADGVAISVIDPEEMTLFLTEGLGGRELDREGDRILFEVGRGADATHVELVHEPGVRPGTWRFAAGTFHHVAVDVEGPEQQQELKDHLEGLGYTDVSERKDRQYFYSCYCRSPSGALVELAYSRAEGWAVDEAPDALGRDFMLPPHLEPRREEIMGKLEPIDLA